MLVLLGGPQIVPPTETTQSALTARRLRFVAETHGRSPVVSCPVILPQQASDEATLVSTVVDRTAEMMPPGTREAEHLHERATQFFYVLQGELTVVIRGESMTVRSAQGLPVPAGCFHEVRNDSSEPAHFLAIAGPNNANDRVDIVPEMPDTATESL